MAFGIEMHTQETDAGRIRGHKMNIACQCWFTSRGDGKPLAIKFEDEDGVLQTVRDIRVLYSEKKKYCGVPTVEYCCELVCQGEKREVKLLFLQEECRWMMTV